MRTSALLLTLALAGQAAAQDDYAQDDHTPLDYEGYDFEAPVEGAGEL